MKNYTAIIEKCADTGLYVGSIPGFPGAHSQAETLDELAENLKEVVSLLYAVPSPTDDVEQDDTEAFLAAVAGGLSENFPDDITDADLSQVTLSDWNSKTCA